MNIKVNLLVCLSHKQPIIQSPELTLHKIISPVSPLSNIKVIGTGEVLKAFVEVANTMAAERVIEQLSGRTLAIGKIKIVMSKYRDIAYSTYVPMQTFKCSAIQNTQTHTTNSDNSQEQIDKFANPGASSQINFFKGKVPNVLEDSSPNDTAIVTNNTIKITHTDMESLKGGRVLRIFRRFGRIVNLNFDYDQTFWLIEYRSDKEVIKITNAILNDTLYGYQLFGENGQNKTSGSLPTTNQLSASDDKFEDDSTTHLQIFFARDFVSIEEASLLMARTHIPNFVYQCIEPDTGKPYFVAQFKKSEQVADVIKALRNTPYELLRCRPLVLA